MSGQSAASATHLPCREGYTFPLPAGVASFHWSQGLLRCGAQVTAGALALPFPGRGYRTGGQPHPSQPGTPAEGKRRGSGRGWFPDRPCPLRDRVTVAGRGPSTYGRQDLLEGGKLPDQALECQDTTRVLAG